MVGVVEWRKQRVLREPEGWRESGRKRGEEVVRRLRGPGKRRACDLLGVFHWLCFELGGACLPESEVLPGLLCKAFHCCKRGGRIEWESAGVRKTNTHMEYPVPQARRAGVRRCC